MAIPGVSRISVDRFGGRGIIFAKGSHPVGGGKGADALAPVRGKRESFVQRLHHTVLENEKPQTCCKQETMIQPDGPRAAGAGQCLAAFDCLVNSLYAGLPGLVKGLTKKTMGISYSKIVSYDDSCKK